MTPWRVTRLNRGLGEHAPAWDTLNQRLFNGHPMLDSYFVDRLLKHFGDGSEHLCVLGPHEEPEAMCLLKQTRLGVWGTFSPSQAQIGPVLISELQALTGLINSLPGFVIRLDFLCIDRQFSDFFTDGNAISTCMDHALTMCIDLNGDFESYWTHRPKKLIQNIARYQRRIDADEVACTFVCIEDPEDIQAAVARYTELESKGWKGKTGTSLSYNAQDVFYGDVLCHFAHAGRSTVYELWLVDQLVASRLVISGSEIIIMLKTTYDESYSKYSPGRILLRKVIKHQFANHPCKRVEFYTDATLDQLAWATEQRWITHWSFYKNSPSADFFSVARAVNKVLSPRNPIAPLADDNTTIEVFLHPDQFPLDVKKLIDDAEHDHFQLGNHWYKNLVDEVYPAPNRVHIYVLRRNGIPLAALPILAVRGTLGWNIYSLSNYYTSLYAPAVAPELKHSDFAALIKAAMDAHSPVASLRFSPMDPSSIPYRRLWNALQANGLAPFSFFCFGNWYLNGLSTWQNYLEGRNGQLRSTIKRTAKKFTVAGGKLELVMGGPDLQRSIVAYEQVYAKSWKQMEPYPNFIPGLIRICAERGWLRLGVAWVDGTPIAAQVWVVVNGKANIYKLAYDENYKSHGSGTLLTAMLMEHVMEKDKVTEVDYLTGDDPYKKAWMSDRRERWGIIAYNPKSFSGALGLAREVGSKTIKYLTSALKRSRVN